MMNDVIDLQSNLAGVNRRVVQRTCERVHLLDQVPEPVRQGVYSPHPP